MNSALAKSEQSLIAVMLITPSISAPNSKRWLLSFVLNITHSSSCSFTGFLASGNPSGLSEKNWDNIDRGSLQTQHPQVQNGGKSLTLKILNCLPQMYPLPFKTVMYSNDDRIGNDNEIELPVCGLSPLIMNNTPDLCCAFTVPWYDTVHFLTIPNITDTSKWSSQSLSTVPELMYCSNL
jgi:hypothetical protein